MELRDKVGVPFRGGAQQRERVRRIRAVLCAAQFRFAQAPRERFELRFQIGRVRGVCAHPKLDDIAQRFGVEFVQRNALRFEFECIAAFLILGAPPFVPALLHRRAPQENK